MFDAMCSWGNLWHAAQQAARGKRRRASAAGFDFQIADRLLALQEALVNGTWRPGAYGHFVIHEPKRRRISAAPFADRVVQHALCQVTEPVLQALLSPHCFANRVGLGTHRALDRLQHLAQRYRYALRCDVVQHFASIDHAVLRAKLARQIGDPQVLGLVDLILASGADALQAQYSPVYFAGDDLFAVNRPRGIPIGNLTSQCWSNLFLNDFDWFVQRELGCAAYLRYVDDFVLFGNDKAQLLAWRSRMIARLACDRLVLHERQTQVAQTAHGIPWLGFVVYPTHRLLKRRNAVNFSRKLSGLLGDYQAGAISFAELDSSVQGWINHVRFADTWGLREFIFARNPISPKKFSAGDGSPAPPQRTECV